MPLLFGLSLMFSEFQSISFLMGLELILFVGKLIAFVGKFTVFVGKFITFWPLFDDRILSY